MRRPYLWAFLLLVGAYTILTLLFPIDPETIARRHLTLQQARVLQFSIIVPMIAVWLLALYGSQKLLNYARSIRESKEGPALLLIARGLQILAIFLPARMLLKSTLMIIGRSHPAIIPFADNFITYFNLLGPLVAFVLIGRAASRLADLVRAPERLVNFYILSVGYIILCIIYCAASFTAPDFPAGNWLVTTQQFIPQPLRTITVVIPYLYIWFVGWLAAYHISLYRTHVAGILYRKLFQLLSLGIVLVITVSIALQLITALAVSLLHVHLAIILAIAYSLLISLGAAFLIIAQGVRRLRRLDEV